MVVVATDAGSSKKAYKYAQELGTTMALLDKRRDGNDDNIGRAYFCASYNSKRNKLFI